MINVSEIFGENVFNLDVMREKLPKDVFRSLKKTIDEGKPLDSSIAGAVAHAMKIAPDMDMDKIIVITISGRGDKDCAAIARYRGEDLHE